MGDDLTDMIADKCIELLALCQAFCSAASKKIEPDILAKQCIDQVWTQWQSLRPPRWRKKGK